MTDPTIQPDPNWQPAGTAGKNRFLPKLGTYLLGVAIGLVFLGWVQYQKHQAAQAQQASQTAAQPNEPGGEAPASEPGSP